MTALGILLATIKRSVSLSANLTDRPWTAWKKDQKQLTPLYDDRIYLYYHNQGKYAITSPFCSDECPSSSLWRKLNASYVMSATDYPPQSQRYAKFSKRTNVSCYFLQKYTILLNLATPYHLFLHFSGVICSLYNLFEDKSTKQR